MNGLLCPITDDQMVLINPWLPHANWRNENDPPITILALYLTVSGRLRRLIRFELLTVGWAEQSI
ncbi:hypothetical protein [Pseudorhodoplanes sinuspersici]|uniref:Uncharacterized protein n=1 Tax=Pseudorhodoplanes sinuspersici TaxID=1235591 RepID=A0A1W6ZM40_9HYPH|nr:hypothetical protein [Pseudorhodoplanes sinuspersici]ARP97834.1 hypothetical protein CAK95_01110 [Pseudorhodoplanes sinuspersici]